MNNVHCRNCGWEGVEALFRIFKLGRTGYILTRRCCPECRRFMIDIINPEEPQRVRPDRPSQSH